MDDYKKYIESKTHSGVNHGFEPVFVPDILFDFQKACLEWACLKGRAALLQDCGLGKTFQQLAWAENIVRKTNGRVLIIAPLAVASQTIKEGEKIGIEVIGRRNGIEPTDKISVTNYEMVDHFNPLDFKGVVCDESSILKHFTGATQKRITRFMTKMPYRLLCTATPSPNDFVELGTSSQALGELSHSEMLSMFFRQLDDKGQKKAEKEQRYAEKAVSHYGKLSFRVAQSIGQWRLKNHAVDDFWRWVASWAKALRMPSDMGFSDDGFMLPELIERTHIVKADTPPEGFLFCVPAFGLAEEREERKRTINERCEMAAKLCDHEKPAVVWCHTNAEGDLLEKIIPGARQIAGRTPNEEKLEIYDDFVSGKLRVIVIKPKIGAWGLNWQHCAHVITFASHSFEQHYQSIRRCWRFGQKNKVIVDIIATEGESRVLANLERKSNQAEVMFTKLIQEMNNSVKITTKNEYTKKEEIPSWL